MNQKEMIRIAKRAIDKRWNFETLEYSDDLYENKEYAEKIGEFVEECGNIGKIAFYEKYPED